MRQVLARVSALVRSSDGITLTPHEASLILNALARTNTLDVPLVLRLMDALRRAPRQSWDTNDLVLVSSSCI